jgi:hypothetical protein
MYTKLFKRGCRCLFPSTETNTKPKVDSQYVYANRFYMVKYVQFY